MKKTILYKTILSISTMLLITACGGDSTDSKQESNQPKNIVGYLVDAPVANMSYRCGVTSAKTESDGKFECPSLPVAFMVGALEVGSLSKITADGRVYPQDLVGVPRDEIDNPKVLKIASFLQSIDDDGDISVSITIPNNIQLSSSQSLNEMTQDEVKNLLEESGITPISLEEAREHLRENLPPKEETAPSTEEEPNNLSEESGGDANPTTETPTDTQTGGSVVGSTTNGSVADTTAPLAPTLTTTPNFTNQDDTAVEVNGESGATLLVNSISKGVLVNSKLRLLLDTSGVDGAKEFNLTLKDSSNNYSNELNLTIIKDSVPPAQNSTIDDLTTDDSTPPLSGNLPSGDSDTNTTNYTIIVKIDDNNYTAINDKDGTWSIADNTIGSLDMGYHDVNITVTDEASNSSSTFIAKKIEIDNTGFLIDSAIEGVKYISGNFSGYTDKDGLFKYDKDAGVTFYIGDESTGISLGSANIKVDPYNPNRRIITLFDLANTTDESNPKVVNMGKFLQSLDADGDVSNGITIDNSTKESIALLNLKNHIDFNQDIEAFHNNEDIYNLMNDLAGHFGEHRGLLPTEDVKAHLVAIRDNKLITKKVLVDKTSGEPKAIKILDGIFKSINGVVEGLEYRSGNQFGRTDENGAFKYEDGKKVKFSIYQLELGTTEAKAVVTPADLVPATSFNHPKPRNIIRLLNAFDKPNTPDIVVIDNAVREALEMYRSQIDINLPDGKANAELGIIKGVDEFGAQFEDFEIGKEILDEIDRLRG